MSIETTLTERGNRYGDYKTHAEITQGLKRLMQSTEGWQRLTDDKRETLDMIAHKIGRLLNGDPEHADNFHDIAGYALLSEKLCKPHE